MARCITNTSPPTLKLAIKVGSDVFLKGMTDDHRSQPPLWSDGSVGGDAQPAKTAQNPGALLRLYVTDHQIEAKRIAVLENFMQIFFLEQPTKK
jgi:hypothetical protein